MRPTTTVDGDEILATTERKAAKPHTCDVCLATIRKGRFYVRSLVRTRKGRVMTYISCDDPRYPCGQPDPDDVREEHLIAARYY